MSALSGYTITDNIYMGAKSRVYRAIRKSDSRPVIIKILNRKYPTFQELVHFKNQYTVGKNLKLPGIIELYSMENYGNSLALVMEDFGGISLSEYQKQKPIDLNIFFAIAVEIIQGLEGLYKNKIIHKDIKPQNILINPKNKQVKIIDFSISTLLDKENLDLGNPNFLEGTLGYISPEQTGRMNRGIDYRTDFYSLGVTFYEMLTNQLPFQSKDALELIHAHIAKKPAEPMAIMPHIPKTLNDIVMKLMAKTAEKRYQSPSGIKYDIENCWRQWNEYHQIIPFQLGKRDLLDRFVIPEKLYGREIEVATLLAAFERVANPPKEGKSQAEMMLVAGKSGIGKTAVINEIHKPIIRQRGYFIKGKFDQFQRDIPFSGFVQAFQALLRQLLTETQEQIENWQKKILDNLGENALVIIDVIPELEEIIGKQPPVAELDGNASQNRFNSLFIKFIHIFATAAHPLVIFLDDLQWADLGSLNLIKLLMKAPDSGYLLIIGAYRDNEVTPAHSLMVTLEELRKKPGNIEQITLVNLSEKSLNELIADTLSCSQQLAYPLTELVYQKTKGNPFFTIQFLRSLYKDNLITFDNDGNYWQCDIAKVKALSLTEDIVEFMALQLRKLPPETQHTLKLASCIGNQFDLETLALISEQSQIVTAGKLWRALQEGLILPVSDIYKLFQNEEDFFLGSSLTNTTSPQVESDIPTYKFLHDRVQQAAYFLIPESDKKQNHLKIGELLLNNIPQNQQDLRIFDIVNQLNIGADLIKETSQKNALAKLNLMAGQKAKTSTAYAAATDYLNKGQELLGSDSWEQEYDLTLGINVTAAEVAYLNADFAKMDALAKVILAKATKLLDRVKIYEIQLSAYTAQVRPQEAVEMGLKVLALLDITFPPTPTPDNIQNKLEEIAELLADLEIENLINLPEMSEGEKQAALRILSSLVSPAYITAPTLLPLIILEMVNLSINYGNAPLSAFGYGLYGLILSGVMVDIEMGYKFGKLALNLVEKYNLTYLKTKVFYTVGAHLIHSKYHFKESLKILKEGYVKGLDTGELELGYCAKEISQFSYLMGHELIELEREIAGYSQALTYLRQDAALNYNQIVQQVVLNLLGESENPCILSGKAYDETQMLPFHIQANDRNGLHYFHFHKMIISYLFEDYENALENATQATQYLDAVTGMVNVPILPFYDSLIRMAIYPDLTEESEREKYLMKIQDNHAKIKNLANHAPLNFLHKFYLLEAEQFRLHGQNVEAMEAYDHAISIAKENEFINEEALSNELAAKFYLSWGKKKIAQSYLIDGYYAYARWGAKAKLDHLEAKYPEFLQPILQVDKNIRGFDSTLAQLTTHTVNSTGKKSSDFLDISAVLKAYQVIGKDLVMEQLLPNLMQIIIENAGASKSALILEEDNNLVIEAIAGSSIDKGIILPSIPITSSSEIPLAIVNYVNYTKETLILDNIADKIDFAADAYIQQYQPISVLCMPLRYQGKTIGILYLENSLVSGAFSSQRLEILRLLCDQAALSIENARLYQKSQNYTRQLEQSLQQLQQTQLQLIQKAKIAAVEHLVTGVAYEINGPLGLISGNLNQAEKYVKDLLEVLNLYQQNLTSPDIELIEKTDEIDLEYLKADLPILLTSMREGAERIKDISTGLRIFSQADTVNKVNFNIHAGLDSTLLILKHQVQANEKRPAIEIIRNYSRLAPIKCYPGELNQVFMNILVNAIEAFDNLSQQRQGVKGQIKITTKFSIDQTSVVIIIQDNGPGMPTEIRGRIFDHLFTTKGIGKNSGLGLSISRQIVEGRHHGQLLCHSTPGEGTEFSIIIPLS